MGKKEMWKILALGVGSFDFFFFSSFNIAAESLLG
jgi:hypothetical protein